jgi:hypothetical protein
MTKSGKARILIAASTLALTGTLAVVANGQRTAGPPGATASTPVREQRVVFSTGPAITDHAIHIRVKNHGAFTADVCVDNTVEDRIDGFGRYSQDHRCIGDILALQEKTLDVITENGEATARVHGYARTGADKVIDTPADGQTHCFRFDGGAASQRIGLIPAFSFQEVDCGRL